MVSKKCYNYKGKYCKDWKVLGTVPDDLPDLCETACKGDPTCRGQFTYLDPNNRSKTCFHCTGKEKNPDIDKPISPFPLVTDDLIQDLEICYDDNYLKKQKVCSWGDLSAADKKKALKDNCKISNIAPHKLENYLVSRCDWSYMQKNKQENILKNYCPLPPPCPACPSCPSCPPCSPPRPCPPPVCPPQRPPCPPNRPPCPPQRPPCPPQRAPCPPQRAPCPPQRAPCPAQRPPCPPQRAPCPPPPAPCPPTPSCPACPVQASSSSSSCTKGRDDGRCGAGYGKCNRYKSGASASCSKWGWCGPTNTHGGPGRGTNAQYDSDSSMCKIAPG